MKLKCIISNSEDQVMKNVALLLLRVLVAGFLLSHGISKIMNFETLSAVFYDPFGLGSTVSLLLVIFAEVICTIFIIIGLFARIGTLVLVFCMSIAALGFHANDPFAVKELAFLILGLLIVMFFAGPGKYAIDSYMCKCFFLDDK